jgi:hypothetical protein
MTLDAFELCSETGFGVPRLPEQPPTPMPITSAAVPNKRTMFAPFFITDM